MADEDYLLALELQNEFNREFNKEKDCDIIVEGTAKQAPKRRWSNEFEKDLNSTCNLVHPEWETLDPTPDIFTMFTTFDYKFFQSRLKCVSLEWSKRMYSCAGICYSRRCRLGMSITIRLSEPLLKLRSRKDLIETLLHEMIHAYCFVLGIREGNGGHGPNFKKIMHGINQVAGTNITVYHTFNDEVNLYKIHWWRCNGICQNRKPFFGYVKRSSNRAPGINDNWWRQHVESCGGFFLKIKGPEPKIKKSNTKLIPNAKNDLRNFFIVKDDTLKSKNGNINTKQNKNVDKGSNKIKSTTPNIISVQSSTPSKYQPKSISGNLQNVVELKDLDSNVSKKNLKTNYNMDGNGYSLSQFSTPTKMNYEKVDNTKIRDIWSKKYAQPTENANLVNLSDLDESSPLILNESPIKIADEIDLDSAQKKRRISTSKVWKSVNLDNDDIIVLDENPELICLSSDDEMDLSNTKTNIKQTHEQRRNEIKQEIITFTDSLEDDIELIDDEYDDNLLNTTSEIADTSLVDDLFGEDTLLKDFRLHNSLVASSSSYNHDPRNDIVTCPICQGKIKREDFEEHLDGCTGITIRVSAKNHSSGLSKKAEDKKQSKKFMEVLLKAGYTKEEISKFLNDEFLPFGCTDLNIKNNRENSNSKKSTDSSITNNGENSNSKKSTDSSITNFGENSNSKKSTDFRNTNNRENSNSKKSSDSSITNNVENSKSKKSTQNCPVCDKEINTNDMNQHLDNCLEDCQF